MRRVQKTISEHREDASSYNQSLAPVVDAYKRKRLTFSWLDGEKQEVILFFHWPGFYLLLFVILNKITHFFVHINYTMLVLSIS